ncbi:MAG: sugar transferase [Muribaculaceae bacterium]|nr:sugar transferase [Muribaculaceae bacterium]
MKTTGTSKTKQRLRYVIADLFTGAIAFWVFNIVRFYLLHEYSNGYATLWTFLGSTKLILEQCIVPPCLLGIYWLSGYYNEPFNKSRLQEFTTTLFSAIINTIIIYLVLLINDQTGRRTINYEIIIVLFGSFFLLTYIFRVIITNYAIQHFRKELWQIKVLIVGNSKVSRKVAHNLSKAERNVKYHVAGFVEIPGENQVKDQNQVIPFETFIATAKEIGINQLVLAPENHDDKKVMKLLSVLFPLDIPVKISPDTFSYVTSAIRMKDIYGEPFIDLTGPAMGDSSKNIKRSFDAIVSCLVLILLSPLYGILALMVKFSSKGSVIYKQERIGRHQKPFYIYKFRSMYEEAEDKGPQLSKENDDRITPTGKWMRKYRLDELPQFWNVLKGEMSIVGPRPEREFFIKQIVEKAPYYTLVCQVRPGITSWGMVKYGYASNVKQMVERTQYDLIYLANMSLSVDCKILIYTLKTVIGGEGL